MATVTTVSTFYDEIGGEATIRSIVHTFYEGVATDPLLRPLYPEEDLGPAEDRFAMFLIQYWGGPTTYSDRAATRGCGCATRRSRSPPSRRSAGWCTSATGLDAADLTAEQDEKFWDYVTHAAQFMVNTLE